MTKLKPESHIAGKGAFQGQRGANAWKATGERKDQGSQSQETGLGKGLKGNLVQKQKIVKTVYTRQSLPLSDFIGKVSLCSGW